MNDSAIIGFSFFTSNFGTIKIQVWFCFYLFFVIISYSNLLKVVNFSICGVNISCARYFSRSHYTTSMFPIKIWNFSVVSGYNYIILDQALLVNKGSMIFLQQNIDSAQIAIDTSGSALYSDLAWGSYLQKLNAYSNYRFYLQPVLNFSLYMTKINIFHQYSSAGLYNVSLTSLSSNQYFSNLMNITDRKFLSSNLLFYTLHLKNL